MKKIWAVPVLLAFVLLIAHTAPGAAQSVETLPTIEVWRDLPTVTESYNIATSGNLVWWHTINQLFRYNRQTGAITTFTRANGLTGFVECDER